jgi:hypothetical protein
LTGIPKIGAVIITVCPLKGDTHLIPFNLTVIPVLKDPVVITIGIALIPKGIKVYI